MPIPEKPAPKDHGPTPWKRKIWKNVKLPPGLSALWGNEDCLREVCSYLGSGDLHSLLTVSRTFYNAATPILYRVLVSPPGCPCHGLPGRNDDLAAKYSTALEFLPHSHRVHHPRLKASRVRTHIVNFDFSDKSTQVDKHQRTAAWGTYKCPNCPKAAPPPERIVLRPTITAMDYQPYDKTPKHVLVPLGTKCADKIVHISLNMGKGVYKLGGRDQRNYRKPVTPTQQLTFILLPRFWDCGHVILGDLKSSLVRTIMHSIASVVLAHHDHAIRVVGLENCDPFVGEAEWNKRKARERTSITTFHMQMDYYLTWSQYVRGWAEDDKEACRNKVTFQTFRDYLEEGNWGEELSWQLVGRWLNALDRREKGVMKTHDFPGPKKRKRQFYNSDTETDSATEIDNDEAYGDDGEWGAASSDAGEEMVKQVKQEVGVDSSLDESESEEEDY